VTTSDEEDLESYEPLLAEMCADFDRFWARPQLNRDTRIAPSVLTFAMVYGLACHARTLVAESLPLFTKPTLAMVPIIRSVFEAGVTAQWLRWVRDSDVSLMRAHRRQQTLLTDSLLESANPMFHESGRHRRAEEEPPIPLGEGPDSASFKAICYSFATGPDLYLHYRMLCGPVHAGVQAADVWLAETDDGQLRVRREPRFGFANEGGWIAAFGLGLAHRALDDMVVGSPRANFLNRAERRAEMLTRLALRTPSVSRPGSA